jgi:hypothetical protein
MVRENPDVNHWEYLYCLQELTHRGGANIESPGTLVHAQDLIGEGGEAGDSVRTEELDKYSPQVVQADNLPRLTLSYADNHDGVSLTGYIQLFDIEHNLQNWGLQPVLPPKISDAPYGALNQRIANQASLEVNHE